MMRALAGVLIVIGVCGALHRGCPAEAGHYLLNAQAAPSVPIWTGSVRCEIDVKGPGYINHQTHTWTLSGALAPNGSALDYPGTWSVTGAGSLQPTATQTAATWKIQGSAPGVRMAIFVRQSDQRLLVLLRHGQLNAPEATMLVRQQSRSLTTAQLRNEQRPTPAAEWRPFPTIADVPTSTHITGSSAIPITERIDAMQPLGSEGQAACTWDLVQGPGGSGSGAAPAGGGAVSVAVGAAAGAKIVTGGAAPAGSASGAVAGAAASAAASTAPAGGAVAGGGATGAIAEGAAATSATRAAGTAPAAGAAASATGGAAGAGAATSPSAAVAAGCDADIVTLACQLPQMSTGLSISYDANFHVATDTSDWYTVTATANASAGPFAVLDLSLTGGTADGSYSIEVSEGAPSSLRSVGNSGAAHAPRTTVAWAAAGSKTLFIQVRHVAGSPANTLYSLRLSMTASQTAPLTIVPLGPGVIGALVPSVPSAQTGTITTGRTPDLQKQPPAASAGTTSSTIITPDGMPNTCALAGNKVVNVSPGLFMIVTGTIEAAGAIDWLTVRFPSAASVRVTLSSPVPIPGGSDFQIATYASCSSPLTSPTTGAGMKTVDLPGSGPRDVVVRITASPWSATGATYSLRLEGK